MNIHPRSISTVQKEMMIERRNSAEIKKDFWNSKVSETCRRCWVAFSNVLITKDDDQQTEILQQSILQ